MRVSKATLFFTNVALLGGFCTAFVPFRRSFAVPWSVSRRFSAVETPVASNAPKYVQERDLYPDMSLLDAAQLTSNVPLAEMTEILLNDKSHPKGTLSVDVLDAAFPVIFAWSKTNSVSGAMTVERILHRLEDEFHCGNEKVSLTSKYYTVAIDAWARSKHYEAAPRAEELLNKMETLSVALENPALEPSRISYNAVMNAWQKTGNTQEVERLLERMQQNPNVAPNTNDYNVLLSAYARRGEARRAEEILGQMVQHCKLVEEDEYSECAPDTVSYNCVLDAWSKSGEAGAAQRADSILSTLRSQYESGESNVRPDAFSFATVANAWVRSGEPDAVEHAEAMLALAEAQDVELDDYMYNAVLAGWAVSTMQGAAFKAQEVLNKMEREGFANSVSYNTVIKAWKNSGEPDAGQRAEDLLIRMEELQAIDYEVDVEPDVFTYTSVIDCYAKSRQRGAAKKAESLLEHMFELYESGNTALKPNTVTVNCVLDALAKSGEKGAADRAERLLTQMESNEGYLDMVQPTTISYSTVIDAFAKSGKADSAQRAEEIFQRMEKAYKEGNEDAKPNIRSFNAVINAWVQGSDVHSVERAEAILNKMELLYKEGNDDIRPTVVSYSIVMNGWAKSGAPDALKMVEKTFNRMNIMYESGNKEARPNLVSFTTLIDAIVKSGEKGAAQRAGDVLHHMFAQFKAGNVDAKPNTKVMTAVMDCWGKSRSSRAGETAEGLLNWMIEKYEKEGDESFQPNEMSFQVAINAWAKSRKFEKAARAKAVLQKMVDMYEAKKGSAKPNVFAYTAVINSCAYTVGDEAGKQEALQIAASTFNELCNSNYGKPNHVTYATYLAACRNLMPHGDARTSMIEAVFRKCCQDGQVDSLVLHRLESCFEPDQLKNMFQSAVSESGKVILKKLPEEWKHNVKDTRSKRGGNRGGRR